MTPFKIPAGLSQLIEEGLQTPEGKEALRTSMLKGVSKFVPPTAEEREASRQAFEDKLKGRPDYAELCELRQKAWAALRENTPEALQRASDLTDEFIRRTR